MDYLTRGQVFGLLAQSLKYALRPRPKIDLPVVAPPAEPIVSVIIPTYNWSSVLRFAVGSVLWQSERNLELLVMGDACTDDSEEVVRSFGDSRVHWHNLPRNFGSQSGPNNAGLELARGRFVAYLGHDDIWRPDHLATLLAATEASGGRRRLLPRRDDRTGWDQLPRCHRAVSPGGLRWSPGAAAVRTDAPP